MQNSRSRMWMYAVNTEQLTWKNASNQSAVTTQLLKISLLVCSWPTDAKCWFSHRCVWHAAYGDTVKNFLAYKLVQQHGHWKIGHVMLLRVQQICSQACITRMCSVEPYAKHRWIVIKKKKIITACQLWCSVVVDVVFSIFILFIYFNFPLLWWFQEST